MLNLSYANTDDVLHGTLRNQMSEMCMSVNVYVCLHCVCTYVLVCFNLRNTCVSFWFSLKALKQIFWSRVTNMNCAIPKTVKTRTCEMKLKYSPSCWQKNNCRFQEFGHHFQEIFWKSFFISKHISTELLWVVKKIRAPPPSVMSVLLSNTWE